MILPLIPIIAAFMTGGPDKVPSMDGPQMKMLKEISIEQRLGEQVPLDLEFQNSDGEDVRLGDLYGEKPVLLSLAYYECPMLCTLVLNGMTKALRALSLEPGQDFNIVTVSIDHEETPELAATKKANYIKEYKRDGAEDGWFFLTGSKENIQQLADAVGFAYQYIPETEEYAHAAGIMVSTPEGRLSHYLYGVEYSTRDLRLGLVEASDNKIGNLVDKITLWCFRYDPMQGKYGFVVVSALRIGGVLTILLVGGFIGISLYRERKKAHKSAA